MLNINFFKQFVKFALVGALNTGVDFLVLNIEMLITGITSGPLMFVQNIISFSIATTNSYFLNKHWTFRDKSKSQEGFKFAQFLTISVIGAFINSAIVYSATTFLDPMFNLSPTLWANLTKLLATGISLIWNFLGYKFIVFKK